MLLNCIGYGTSNDRTSVNDPLERAQWYSMLMPYFKIIQAITQRNRGIAADPSQGSL